MPPGEKGPVIDGEDFSMLDRGLRHQKPALCIKFIELFIPGKLDAMPNQFVGPSWLGTASSDKQQKCQSMWTVICFKS